MDQKLCSIECKSNFQNIQYTGQSQNELNSYFPHSTVPINSINNHFSPTNYIDMYSNGSLQNINRNYQNYYGASGICSASDPIDTMNWENRVIPDVEKVVKIPEKIERIDISSKDLSPASFVSNIDVPVSNNYKPARNMNEMNHFNRYNNQWYNQGSYIQKNYELPSCAQIAKQIDRSSEYCSIQKNCDFDHLSKSCSYTEATFPESTDMAYKNGYKCLSDDTPDYNSYNCYDKFQYSQSVAQNDNFFFNAPMAIPFVSKINPIDQQTEDSNDESDIIVEESDEEVTDYSEDQEKRQYCQANKCLVCNLSYTPMGTQFYYLTAESPLTMSSQKPVINKIVEVVGVLPTTRNYLCSECLGLINTIDHLQLKLEHFNDEFITKFEKTCKENDVSRETKIREIKPIKNVNKFPKYRCKLCKKVLCLKNYFYYHMKKHKTRKFLCDQCGMVSRNRKKFLLHMKMHKKIVDIKLDPFKCSNCEKTFRTKSNLKEHVNYCLGILPFKCKIHYCNKKFASANKLKNHVKLKHDKKFIAICSICNIGFVKVSDYKSHMVTHSTDKKYSCSKCSKSYKTLSNLNFHMKIHNTDMPFSCDICGKGFMRKEYLEAHVNNHKGIKNYVCTVCDKRFASQKNLDAHLKYHEGTVKKNTCNICGKTMTSGFEEHLRIHSNLKEFECEYCDMRFNTRGTLHKHVKKKHKDVQLNK